MLFLLSAIIVIAVAALFYVQHRSYKERLRLVRESYEQQLRAERDMTGDRFKALAADVLRDNSRQLGDASIKSLLQAVAPVRQSLDEFSRQYRECYEVENRDRISLREEIRSLHSLNTRVGDEAARLSQALRGNNSVQGKWGEMILTNILEHSGLQKGRWFVTQESSTTADGSRLRPDAIIHCPGDRDIIIDAKANLSHYLRAAETDDAALRESLLKEHAQAVERQMASLSRKEYHANVGAGKGDFVIMFMPHEGAYIAAMNARPQLWEQAYDSHVIIASPTHLVTVVRLVEKMWQAEDTSENAQKIAATASTMLDSVAAFLADFDTLGKTLEKASQQYEGVVRRLSTGNNNVARVADRLRELGVRGKKG